MATIEDFKKIEIRVGRILSAEPVAGSLKLLKLMVHFGEVGDRQIIAGIASHFSDSSLLVGKKYAFAFNLEPRGLMGLESQGMILAVGETGAFSLLSVDLSVMEGSLIR
jgi:methionine--tRNA ligase beta chain